MFPAGNKASFQGVNVGAGGFSDDWLRVGKSFPRENDGNSVQTKQNIDGLSESSLQVYTHRQDSRSKEKKRHKKKNRIHERSMTVNSRESRHLAKHTKGKIGKLRRSSDRDHSSSRRSCRHSNSILRSVSRNQKEEWKIVKQSVNDVLAFGDIVENPADNLFAFDRLGDRENSLFGSSYIHDQPFYELASRRILGNGGWVPKAPLKSANTDTRRKKNLDQDLTRYFSSQARRMEKNGRQKRLYLAYSAKRLSRLKSRSNDIHLVRETGVVGSSLPEMEYIPLDPLLETDSDDMEEDVFSGTNEITITEGQSVEQHLIERGKLLNAAVTSHPDDIDTWLDLIAFQEQTICLQTQTKQLTSAIKESVVKKQAAILTKALTYNPDSRELHRVKLNMSLQNQIGYDLADIDSSQQQQLENLIANDLTNCDLWLKRLQSQQQHFGSFSVQSVRDLYARIITVLRVERGNVAATGSEISSTFNIAQADELPVALLDFHLLLCQFERSAGYAERSIAHLQALLDFNLNEVATFAKSESKPTHLVMLQLFAQRWNEKSDLTFGDDWDKVCGPDIKALKKDCLTPSLARFQEHIENSCVVNINHVNPPTVLQTHEHKTSLLLASAAYKRRSRPNNRADTEESTHEDHEYDFNSTASDDSELIPGGDRLIYSNLHGYRIKVNDANDAKEYERILNTLRGTSERRRAEQIRLREKEKRRRALLAATVSQLEDERANYDKIDKNDRFINWLYHENVQIQLQWAPLHSNNTLHRNLIEQQPDRVTLVDEIQPFLFSLPTSYQWRLVAEILQICGVEWQGEFSWESSFLKSTSMYAGGSGNYDLLVGPILSVLNLQSGEAKSIVHMLLLKPCDRLALLENALLKDVTTIQNVLCNPDKVNFVRQIFAQGLSLFQSMDEYDRSALKCLWIGFELEIIRSIGVTEERIANVRHFCQILAKKTTDDVLDFDVLYSYAKLEFTLRNERQVQRICENALRSLAADTMMSRCHLHSFIFLYARLELWSSAKNRDKPQLRVLRSLYILWNAQQLVQQNGIFKESLRSIAKKCKNRVSAYLKEKLMSDPSTKIDLFARYRADLDFAVRQCAHSASRIPSHTGKKPYRSKCWVRFCLHNLVLVIYAYDGFKPACDEYRQFLASSEHRDCAHNVWAWTCFLDFMQQHHVASLSPTLAPRIWRSSISEAVKNFPNNELFLRLFADSESGNTISQVLRNYFLRVEMRWRRHYDSPELVEWLFALLCEFYRIERTAIIMNSSTIMGSSSDSFVHSTCCIFHRWGLNAIAVNRIRQLFEKMVNQIRTKGIALCWELYMRFEVAMGKVDAATKVLYRGIAACAWSKSLYMTGLCLLRAYLSDDECQELFEFMEAKELSVRADLR
ncbi:Uncharacterized conserved protein [Plasmopara halstedii]|uniref:Uncharacterized conserved protein n=1 Tax=Plasmopara halstedii TaxID=4781 RepID=A0A0N7L8B0_PLAHL|nr:Uncharacterized conserved protein [Plasmopara halstedii]CEG49371.1 Uncharacterized conserved protein [Plasmopara halstedii]|eukprot:XP_024585740.1 Uncharacterized conserved protein [Plasmopara halstedii]